MHTVVSYLNPVLKLVGTIALAGSLGLRALAWPGDVGGVLLLIAAFLLALLAARFVKLDRGLILRKRVVLDAVLCVLAASSVVALLHRYEVDRRALNWTYEAGPTRGGAAAESSISAWGATRRCVALHAPPDEAETRSLPLGVPNGGAPSVQDQWPSVVSAELPIVHSGLRSWLGLPEVHWRVRLAFTQPEWAVLDPNGPTSVTSGDGVRLRVAARSDSAETVLAERDITPQADAAHRRWHEVEANLPPGVTTVAIQALPGLAGSHNYSDHVYVNVARVERRIGGLNFDTLLTIADAATCGFLAIVLVGALSARRRTVDHSVPRLAGGIGRAGLISKAGEEGSRRDGRHLDERSPPSRWPLIALLLSPAIYPGVLVFPPPFGRGLHFANDFVGHRIWYAQVDAYFVSKGYFALWNPTFEFGNASLAGAFGTGALYPLRWWTYLPTYFGGVLNYYTQYLQVALHMAIGLGGLYLLLRRHAGVGQAAAALGASVFLLNQCFNNFIRFPHGIENACWVPWMLHFALNLTLPATDLSRRQVARDFFGLALCVALGWLAGYGQFSYMGALLVGLIAICCGPTLASFLRIAAAGLLGTLAAIGAILPAVEWAVSHPLRGGRDIANIATIGVTHYAETFLGPFGVDVHHNTFTLPVFLLIGVVGLVTGLARGETRRTSLALLLAFGLMLEITRGDAGYLFALFYKHLPFFSAFNSPAKYAWLLFVPLAWFVGLGVEQMVRPRWRIAASAAVVGVTAAVAWLATPEIAQPVVGMHQPLAMGWLTEPEAAVRLYWLVWISAAAIVLFVLVRRPLVQAAALIVIAGAFSLFFASKATFFSNSPEAAAMISSTDAFPNGLLARRSSAEYLRLRGIGVTSPNVDPAVWHLIVSEDERVLGPLDAEFPRTRFLWEPDEPHASAKIELVSFGPNHAAFDINASGPGYVTWLTRYSPHWRLNVATTRLTPYDQFFRMRIGPGVTRVNADFVPLMQIAAAIATMLLLGGLAAAVAWTGGQRGFAISAAIAGLVLAAAVVAGSLTRQGMSERDVFGVAGVSRAADARLMGTDAVPISQPTD